MVNINENEELKKRIITSQTIKKEYLSEIKSPPSKLSQSKDTIANTTVMFIFISLLLDLLAFTMILPLLPSLMDYYKKEEGGGTTLFASILQITESFQKYLGAPEKFNSVLFGGALGSMYCFLQFLTSPIIGSLSDAYGRKPMLLLCLTGIAISHAIWLNAQTFSMFVFARFIGGLSKANVSLSMAIVTDVTNEKSRAKGMALVGLAFSIGFIVGPLAGAWFAINKDTSHGQWGERPAFYAMSLSSANILLALFFFPETLPENKRAPLSFTLSKSIEYISPWHLLRLTAVKNLSERQKNVLSKLGLIYFLYLFIYSGLEFTITFLTHHTFGYSTMQQGKMFLVIGVIMAVLQGGAARRLGARGSAAAARLSLALTPLSYLAVAAAALPAPPGLAPEHWLWIGLVLYAISTAFAVSCMSSAAGGHAGGARGAALGALRSLGSLARALGPLLASTMYWSFGAPTTYIVGSIFLIIPAVMLYRLKF